MENETLRVIKNRKSVRNYLDKPVSEEDLKILIKSGMAAPSAVDMRPWDFVVVTKESTLKALADVMPFGKMLPGAGAAVVVCGVPEKSVPDALEFWVQDCSAASENILLAAESLGLGAVWLGVYPIKERVEGVRKILNIPENVVPLNILSIGYPKGLEKPKDKFEMEKIHRERW
jgi:nitroreductase